MNFFFFGFKKKCFTAKKTREEKATHRERERERKEKKVSFVFALILHAHCAYLHNFFLLSYLLHNKSTLGLELYLYK